MDQKKEYNNLKNVLLDKKTEIPLRFKKNRNFISSTDEKGEILWNKGNF